MIKILLTKKISNKNLNNLQPSEFNIENIDFIRPEYVPHKQIKAKLNHKSKLYIVSSARAAKCAIDLELNGTYYVVGEKSALLLNQAKYNVAHTALTAKDLIAFFELNIKEKLTLNFLCSKIRRKTIPIGLKKLEHEITEIICYNTLSKTVEIENNYDAYAFFSPSGANSFFKQYDIHKKACIFAIGKTTAKEIKKWTKQKPLIPDKPKTKALIQTIKTYFHAQK